MLYDAVQQSESAACLPIPSLFFGFPFRLGHPRAIKEGPLSYAVGSHWLSVLCIVSRLHICHPNTFCPEMELVCPTTERLSLSSLSSACCEPSYQAALGFETSVSSFARPAAGVLSSGLVRVPHPQHARVFLIASCALGSI